MKKSLGRHEIKHYINYSDYVQLKARLPCVCKEDANMVAGKGYRVRSLYFDNCYDKALIEKINGVNEREKFRLRLYNGDTSFIRLEKKSKINGICYKRSTVINEKMCSDILNGDYSSLKESSDPLLLEFYAKINFVLLRPKNIVDYQREAYVFPAGNIRITIDTDIKSCFDTMSLLKEDIISVPIQGSNILEVKYDAFLPEIIRGIVSLSSRRQSSFSKYAATRII